MKFLFLNIKKSQIHNICFKLLLEFKKLNKIINLKNLNLKNMKQNKLSQKHTSNNSFTNNSNQKRPNSANKKDIKINNKSPIYTNNNQVTEKIDFKLLLENENDTYENLKLKNSKLRTLIIQASNKINELTNKLNLKEKEYQEEKKLILMKLDKISKNYKIYAESFQQNTKIKNDYELLNEKYEQNIKVISNYQKDIITLLSDFMKLYSNISNFIFQLNNSNLKNIRIDSSNFIKQIKDFIEKKIIKFDKKIDYVNFQNFYHEYSSFLLNIKNEKKLNEEENKLKNKKSMTMRKKEYLTINKKPNNITYSNNKNNYSDINESYLKSNKSFYDFHTGKFDENKNRFKNNNHQRFKRELLFNDNMKNDIIDDFENNDNYFKSYDIQSN